jgi:hypothetical protein
MSKQLTVSESELRALQHQMIVKRVQPPAGDLLLPHERSVRNVWATFRWREAWTVLMVAGLLLLGWAWWCVDAVLTGGGK